MKVERIVANITAADVAPAEQFYGKVLGRHRIRWRLRHGGAASID